jgi:hypothetical protein
MAWHAEELANAKAREAVPPILKLLDRTANTHQVREILMLLARLDGQTAQAAAGRHLSSTDIDLQLCAGTICLKTGRKGAGIRAIGETFERKAEDWKEPVQCVFQAVEALLEDGSPDARRAAAKALRKEVFFCFGTDRVELLKLFMQAREPRMYEFCRRMLADNEEIGSGPGGIKVTVAMAIAEDVFRSAGQNGPALQQQAQVTRQQREEYVAAADRWLEQMATAATRPTTARD